MAELGPEGAGKPGTSYSSNAPPYCLLFIDLLATEKYFKRTNSQFFICADHHS